MYRYKLTIEYHGGFFCGWQRQKDAPSVQQTIEEALQPLLLKNDAQAVLHCAGRTDTGVHALAQVAHVDLSRNMDGYKLLKALNYYLKEARVKIIVCKNLGLASETDFHARFSCIERAYEYRIVNRLSPLAIAHGLAWQVDYDLDAQEMHEAAQYLIGKHDLTSFRAAGCQANSPIRTIDEVSVMRQKDEVIFSIRAQSFLYHQVRNIVGSLVLVGKGKWTAADFTKVLQAKDRTLAGPTAPAEGLYFVRAKYN
ncbi:MAG: tRNA pseudouridine(38-40) synthase TruA [Alphaproteobacteria bacterium]